MKVEVDLDDLETLIFATGVINTIESALVQRKQDPFVKPHLDYTNAQRNLVAAMNSAKRVEANTAVAWDGALSKEEINFLQSDDILSVIDGVTRLKQPEIDSLAAKGCIQIGQMCEGAVWPGESKADIRPLSKFLVRITVRGLDKLEKLAHAGK